ncbi:MAG: hypothetical protein H6606_05980 [Flavobacteriales bacterium]|nr:hypothetical protein [Flavobacteriales bacterium]
MSYRSILERVIIKLRIGLKDFHSDQKHISEGIFSANFEPLDEAAETIGIRYNEPNALFNHNLRRNLGYFALRKTLHEQRALTAMLTNADGKLRSFEEFYQASKSILNDYNRNWLAAEYKTTVRAARMATRWQEAQRDKDLYPNIEYLPSRAATPREDHRKYYHVIRPVDDPFWDEHLPPNGWNCMCGFKTTDKAPNAVPEDLPQPAKGFRHNVGKSAKPFDSTHPYYHFHFPDQTKLINDFKIEYPMYSSTNSGVQVSLWADAFDLEKNLNVAERIVSELSLEVKIRPHLIEGGRNPEFLINELTADLFTVEASNIDSAIHNAFAHKRLQMPKGTYGLVIDLTFIINLTPTEAIARRLYGSWKANKRCGRMVIFTKNSIITWEKGVGFAEILDGLKIAKGSN